jgi:hypothetical protein
VEDQFAHAISACTSWVVSEAEINPQGEWVTVLDRNDFTILLNRTVRLALGAKTETVYKGADEPYEQKECSVSGFEQDQNSFAVEHYSALGFDVEKYWAETSSYPQVLAVNQSEKFALDLISSGDFVVRPKNKFRWELLKCDPKTTTIISIRRNIEADRGDFPLSIELFRVERPPTMFNKELSTCFSS